MEIKLSADTLLQNNETVQARQLAEKGKGSGIHSEREKVAAKKAARDFESLFVGMMLQSMRSTVGKDSLTGGGRGEEVFRSLLDQEYATMVASQGSMGIARAVERQLVGPAPSPAPAVGMAQEDKRLGNSLESKE